MSTTGGPAGNGGARAVMLVRYLPYRTTIGPAGGEVHLLPLPLRGEDGRREVISALCGRGLHIEHIETVLPGQGLWCTWCFVVHVLGGPPAVTSRTGRTGLDADRVAGRSAAEVAYQRLGWPVTRRRGQVTLDLELDVDAVALLLPVALVGEVADVLTRRRCPPPVLAHPATPTHRVIVAGEPCPVPLDWPVGVHRITRTLLLPPSVTTWGPLCWVRPPQPDALRLCKEINVISALRAVLRTPPPRPNAAGA